MYPYVHGALRKIWAVGDWQGVNFTCGQLPDQETPSFQPDDRSRSYVIDAVTHGGTTLLQESMLAMFEPRGTQLQRNYLVLEVISIAAPAGRQLALHFGVRDDPRRGSA